MDMTNPDMSMILPPFDGKHMKFGSIELILDRKN